MQAQQVVARNWFKFAIRFEQAGDAIERDFENQIIRRLG
jgi:hypothetical protein